MNKYFRVTPKKGDAPVSIIADTILDAQCQARELCDGRKPFAFVEELLPTEYNDKMYSQLNEKMAAMFL